MMEANLFTTNKYKFRDCRDCVVVAHVISPVQFYVRYLEDDHKFHAISTHLSQWANRRMHVESSLKAGFMVQVNHKNKYYRGIVHNLKTETSFEIFLIDQGEFIEVTKDDCYKVPKYFLSIPGLAKFCHLSHVTSGRTTWSEEDIYEVTNMLHGHPECQEVFRIKVLNVMTSHSLVELYFLNRINVYEAMCNLIYGLQTNIPKMRDKCCENDNFQTNATLDVVISHVNNPGSLYIRKYMPVGYGQKTVIEMVDHYIRNNQEYRYKRVYTPFIGMFIAFEDSDENKFYRAEITRMSEGKLLKRKFTINLVDSGVELTTSWYSLYQLPHDLLKYTKQAVHCRLSGISPSEQGCWSLESIDTLINLRNEEESLIVKVENVSEDKVRSIVLYGYENGGEYCVNFLLVKLGYVIGFSPHKSFSVATDQSDVVLKDKSNSKALLESPDDLQFRSNDYKNDHNDEDAMIKRKHIADRVAINATDDVTIVEINDGVERARVNNDNDDIANKFGIKSKVRILKCDSPGEIYLTLIYEAHRYDEFIESMKKFYSNVNGLHVKTDYNRSTLYCVRIDDEWYRGRFVNEISNDDICIFLVDFKKLSTVRKNCVYILDERFKAACFSIIKCYLKGIVPAGAHKSWPAGVIEWFKNEITMYDKFYTQRKLQDDSLHNVVSGTVPVELWAKKGAVKVNLNKYLKESGFALSAESIPKTSVGFKSNSSKIIGSVNSLNTKQISDKSISDNAGLSDIVDNDDLTNNLTFSWLEPKKLTKNRFVVDVVFVTDDAKICVQKHTELSDLENVDEALQRHCADENSITSDVRCCKNQSVIAKYSGDNRWYRGRVIQVFERETKAKVEFVDYGNEEVVQLSNLRLRLIATKFPIFCYKVKLTKLISMIGKHIENDALLRLIRSETINRSYLISVTEDEEGSYEIDSMICKDGCNDFIDFLKRRCQNSDSDKVANSTNQNNEKKY